MRPYVEDYLSAPMMPRALVVSSRGTAHWVVAMENNDLVLPTVTNAANGTTH
jgi:hypothetical protein